jgi:negative regulator of flagellin synthesis FlgM
MSNRIFGGNGIGPMDGIQRAQQLDKAKAGKGTAQGDFASSLQEAGKARAAAAPQSAERAQKLAALKAQIESGSYQPNLEKVAESLLKFIAKEK